MLLKDIIILPLIRFGRSWPYRPPFLHRELKTLLLPNRSLLLSSNLDNINNPPFNSMRLPLKPTVLAPFALVAPLPIIWASMPVDTAQIIAIGAKFARRHSRYIFKRC